MFKVIQQKHLLNKILMISSFQIVLIFALAIIANIYKTNQDESKYNNQVKTILTEFEDEITQEIYINSIIQESTLTDLPAWTTFVQTLKSASIPLKMNIESCKNQGQSLGIITIPNGKNFCIQSAINQQQFRFLFFIFGSIFLLSIIVCSPLYFTLLKTVESESYLKAKNDIASEVAHNAKSPLLSLKAILESLPLPLATQNTIFGEIEHLKQVYGAIDCIQQKAETENIVSLIIDTIKLKEIEYNKSSTSKFLNIRVHNKIKSHPHLSSAISEMDLKSIISNLINNSFNALKVSDSPRLTIELSKKKAMLLINIIDNGCGISFKNKKKIFQKGFSHGNDNGTGSGLYQAKYKLAAIGGSIKLISNQAPTSFEIAIPISNFRPREITPRAEKSFVILDDDKVLLKSLDNLIQSKHPQISKHIVYFNNIKDLQKFTRNHTNKDLCYIIDAQLNENNGLEGLEFAKSLHKQGMTDINIFSGWNKSKFNGYKFINNVISKNNTTEIINFIHQSDIS